MKRLLVLLCFVLGAWALAYGDPVEQEGVEWAASVQALDEFAQENFQQDCVEHAAWTIPDMKGSEYRDFVQRTADYLRERWGLRSTIIYRNVPTDYFAPTRSGSAVTKMLLATYIATDDSGNKVLAQFIGYADAPVFRLCTIYGE